MTLTYVAPTKPSRPFKRGDIVDVMDRDGKRLSTYKITHASKRRVLTDCGRSWDQRGWWLGANGSYPFPWIRHSRRKSSDNHCPCGKVIPKGQETCSDCKPQLFTT